MSKVGRAVLVFLSLGVAAYAIVGYTLVPLGGLVHPDMRPDFVTHPTAVYLHVFAASVALLLGPFQFSTSLRQSRPGVHRWMGRLYLTGGVLLGGLSGLYLARFAFGGVVARVGFGSLAVLWLVTGLRAFLAIRQGSTVAHRRWMIRNFALSCAAISLRLYIPASNLLGIEFAVAYAGIAWLCWLPNLVLAEWRWNGRRMARVG